MKQHNAKLAYICSPYRGDVKRNKEYAREITRIAITHGFIPVTPHLYFTEALDDNVPEERELGLAAGIELLKRCDFIIIGEKYGVSEGMSNELHTALENDVRFLFAGKEAIYITSQKDQWEREVQQ